MQRTVAHEVAHELSELRAHGPGDARPVIAVPVQISERRQRDLARLADQPSEHHRHPIAGLDLGQPSPRPIAIGIDDLDAVGRGALDPVAPLGLHRDHLL